MDFYQALSEYYDEIFPLKETQKNFLLNYLQQESLTSVLDIGCGTGTIALETSKMGVRVFGVDLSEDMIKLSQKKAQKAGSNAAFAAADMRDLSSIQDRFDGIFCLGNTLAHVSGEIELHQVLTQFSEKGSNLLIQIVNYDRILAKQISELPVIQTPTLAFYRYYTPSSDGKIEFSMRIEFPDTGEIVSSVNLLYPLKMEILKDVLLKIGWEISGLWGNYDNDPWSENSPATILAARYRL